MEDYESQYAGPPMGTENRLTKSHKSTDKPGYDSNQPVDLSRKPGQPSTGETFEDVVARSQREMSYDSYKANKGKD